MNQQILDDRGWITKFRRKLPPGISDIFRIIFLWFLRLLPTDLKYSIASKFQDQRYPYKLVKEGDRVVQVGAPHDILRGGRSRAIHFARAVGRSGHVIVVEPDPKSVHALESFLQKHGLSGRVTVVSLGAWKEKGSLEFCISAKHPASNRVTELGIESDKSPSKKNSPDYEISRIEVDSLANILERNRFEKPTLISITTNGAEREILNGLWMAGERFLPRYISLAPPNDANIDIMRKRGFKWLAWDDRGQLFVQEH